MKIGVLVSGGVDSAAAALLLQQAGHQVVAITMINWHSNIVAQAAQVAGSLGIEHHVIDVRQQFASSIIENFCSTYQTGATPNPCVMCNELLKFGHLLEYAQALGCDKIATGHYARVERKQNGKWALKKGLDLGKDQSYFLYRLTQPQLSAVVFPLGDLSKDRAREIVRMRDLHGAHSEESQEICFISGDYREFLLNRVAYRAGDFVDKTGRVLGRHRGIPFYTIGQRRGLGLNTGMPMYVLDIDETTNRVVVGPESDLYTSALMAVSVSNTSPGLLLDGLHVRAKIRYRAPEAEAKLTVRSTGLQVSFAEPQRAVTRGQSVVFYSDDEVLGGGIIA